MTNLLPHHTHCHNRALREAHHDRRRFQEMRQALHWLKDAGFAKSSDVRDLSLNLRRLQDTFDNYLKMSGSQDREVLTESKRKILTVIQSFDPGTMGEDRTGEKVAERLGKLAVNSSLKAALSDLVRRDYLENRHPGYWLTAKGRQYLSSS